VLLHKQHAAHNFMRKDPPPSDRARTIDIARGLLFVLMSSTHATSMLKLPSNHWLLSALWLPRGWATVTFAVLSGYGLGFVYAGRQPAAARNRALFRRSGDIVFVMLLSNTIFSLLKLVMAGSTAPAFTLGWWVGFVTLDTEWSISAVLLPTALLPLLAPVLFRGIYASRWGGLALLVALRILVSMLALGLGTSAYGSSWAVRFWLVEGFGGYPVLPYVLNGCLGLWLGMMRLHHKSTWVCAMAVLLLLQIAVYLTSLVPPLEHGSLLVASAGAVGKFAWIYLCALALATPVLHWWAAPLAHIGKHALNSFVLHRMFVQALGLGMVLLGGEVLASELRYGMLWIGTLALTWMACGLLQGQRSKGHNPPYYPPYNPAHGRLAKNNPHFQSFAHTEPVEAAVWNIHGTWPKRYQKHSFWRNMHGR
jgi:hypothetical protein